jgi:hypothetical protein
VTGPQEEDAMSNSSAGPAVGTTTLLFQAPPAPAADSAIPDPAPGRPARKHASGTSASAAGALRMLKGARAAAAGMKISDEQIRAVLEDPQDVQPDPKQPHRTRLSRQGITVTTGNDGMILRVTRRR